MSITRAIAIAATVGLIGVPGPAPVSAATPELTAHPRIWLDAPTLADMRLKAENGHPSWRKLKRRCDAFLDGTVSWPDGNDYPSDNSIGEGYQGNGYFSPMVELGLCYQTTKESRPARARLYAGKGKALLKKMSAPPSDEHWVNPLRDSGYGIRFFATGLAIGYDWFYERLSPQLRERVVAAIERWIERFEADGFENDFPLGNYFAGYYAGKGLGAIAIEGDSDRGHLSDFLDRVHGEMVQPYFSENLSGGGWPEGWNYGPLATLNMSWTVLAVRTASGLDLTNGQDAFEFPQSTPTMMMHSTWPDRTALEDSNAVYEGDNPTPTSRWFFTAEAGLAYLFDTPEAATFHNFAHEVRRVSKVGSAELDLQRWVDFLFWPGAPTDPALPSELSYAAEGMDVGLVRSSWDVDGVWASFKGGPYTACPCSGEEYFDKGGLAIVKGSRPFLVNAHAALLRNTPGTDDGSPYFTPIYEALFDTGQRDFFNIFYVDSPEPVGQGEYLRSDGATTELSAFDDGDSYVFMQASGLEDQYPQYRHDTQPSITGWTREVLYVRPDLFIIDDETNVIDAGLDQWMAFHFPGAPEASGDGSHEVSDRGGYLGTIESIYPAGSQTSTEDVFDSGKVYRLEIRPASTTTETRWLTVLHTPDFEGEAFESAPLSPGDGVTAGDASGVTLTLPGPDVVYLKVDQADFESLDYLTAAEGGSHFITGVEPGAGYSVAVSTTGSGTSVEIRRGGPTQASEAGVLTFSTQS